MSNTHEGALFDIKVRHTEAELAMQMAKTRARSSEAKALHTTLMEQKCEYSRLNRRRDKLPERIGMLCCIAQELEFGTKGVRIINRAVGARVVSPRPCFNVIVDVLLGLPLALALAFGLDYLRRADASSAE